MKGLLFIIVAILAVAFFAVEANAQCPGGPCYRAGVVWTPQPIVQPGTVSQVAWTRPALFPWNRWQVRTIWTPNGPPQALVPQSAYQPNRSTIIIR